MHWCYKTDIGYNSNSIGHPKFEMSDDMMYITVNHVKKIFLRYDNQDQTGNRILVFFSDIGAKIIMHQRNGISTGHLKIVQKYFYYY